MSQIFTKPDRSNYTHNFTKTADNDQLDIGWNEGFLSDGRAYRVEPWTQDGVMSVSLFTPTAGIENISNEPFVSLFESEGLITWLCPSRRDAYARPRNDVSGNTVWQVIVTLAIADELIADPAFKFLPYGSGALDPTDLADLEDNPDALLDHGFERTDQETTDILRWVRYSKAVASSETQLRIIVGIEFHLSISDEPDHTYVQNHSYSFSGVRLAAQHRQMERIDNVTFDEETEAPRTVASVKLQLNTLEEVETLLRLLRFKDRPYLR